MDSAIDLFDERIATGPKRKSVLTTIMLLIYSGGDGQISTNQIVDSG